MKPKPYIAAAFVCEKLLREKDEVLTAVRIVDTFSIETAQLPPAGGAPVLAVALLISFKSGEANGEYAVSITLASPSGKIVARSPEGTTLLFQGEEKGANIVANFAVPTTELGLYWFDVRLEGETMTRVPLKLQAAAVQESLKP